MIEEAGARALELNVQDVSAEPRISGAQVERRCLEVVAAARPPRCRSRPRVGPYFSALPHLAAGLAAAGADALVLFNRFYQPDLDLETLRVRPRLALSSREELGPVLRWIGILRGRVGIDLAATSGVHEADDALKALLVGADVVQMTSALMRSGLGHLGRVEADLAHWMDDRGYESVAQLRGSVSQLTSRDPLAFDRSNYLTALVSYSSASMG
jgi:dihydroorotate dehydrogenase (fumarate)